MLSLLLAMALGQSLPLYCADWKNPKTCYYGSRVSRDPRQLRGFGRSVPSAEDPYAFFEFAPASGAGMGTACACAAVTGAKGEAVTATRAGSAYCTKEGLATTGLTTTSMVLCGSNLPRVEADGDGVLGLLVENAATNPVLRSQEIEAAGWDSANSGVAGPTITADYGVAPDGTTTADRVVIPATTSGQYSYRYQSGFTAVQRTTSVYIKGNGTSGTVNLLSGVSANACTACAYVADTWSRCSLNSSSTAATVIFFGNDSADVSCTTSSKGAQDILVWGFQHETGLYATSYIPTTSAAVTRVKDAYTVPGASFPGTAFSLFATVTTAWSVAPDLAGIFEGQIGSATGVGFFFIPNSAVRFQTMNAGSLNLTTGNLSPTPKTAYRVGGVSESGNSTVYWNGSISAGPTAKNVPAAPWATATGIGYLPATTVNALDGIISKLCLDSSTTRCR